MSMHIAGGFPSPQQQVSLHGSREKIVSAAQAVQLIRDGDVICTSGFIGSVVPDELLCALEKRFMDSGSPKKLTLMFAAGQGDGKTRGLNRLGHEGLLGRVIGGHFGLAPKIGKLALSNKVEAYNLPQGCIAHMFRAVAGGKPGIFSKVGLGTFVDPRLEGGKVNECTTEDMVTVVPIEGEEHLYYKCPKKIHIALLRGTTADSEGNISMEREALILDSLHMAMAAKNSGGYVIVQVERLAANGTLNPRNVVVPGIFVDCVVLASPENHMQTYETVYNPGLSGELQIPLRNLDALPLDDRKIISRRGAMELRPNSILNLGIGMPEGVARVANEEKILKYFTLTAEAGVIGGMPASGLDFGTAVNTRAIIPQSDLFDFYDGGGLDAAYLGLAECDACGNLNVSRFAGRLAGCGGFINISQNAKQVYFLGTFTTGGLKVQVKEGKVHIIQEGKQKKFVNKLSQITFSAAVASKRKQKVLYITERCVFKLNAGNLELVEIAPGIDLQQHILSQMEFKPVIRDKLKLMDSRIFQDNSMKLKSLLLSVPIAKRISYNKEQHILFLNFEGLKIKTTEDVDVILGAVESHLKVIVRPGLRAFINYDMCYIDEEVMEYYTGRVKYLIETYKYQTFRFTTSAFLRFKLGKNLEKRDAPAHIFETEAEARANL